MMMMTMTAVSITVVIIVMITTITNYLKTFLLVHFAYSDHIFSTATKCTYTINYKYIDNSNNTCIVFYCIVYVHFVGVLKIWLLTITKSSAALQPHQQQQQQI